MGRQTDGKEPAGEVGGKARAEPRPGTEGAATAEAAGSITRARKAADGQRVLLSPHSVLAIQRAAGQRAVAALLSGRFAAPRASVAPPRAVQRLDTGTRPRIPDAPETGGQQEAAAADTRPPAPPALAGGAMPPPPGAPAGRSPTAGSGPPGLPAPAPPGGPAAAGLPSTPAAPGAPGVHAGGPAAEASGASAQVPGPAAPTAPPGAPPGRPAPAARAAPVVTPGGSGPGRAAGAGHSGRAGRHSPGGGVSGLPALEERATARRSAVRTTAGQRKAHVRAAAQTAVGTITATTAAEQARAVQSVGAALTQIRLDFTTARTNINVRRQARLTEVRDVARTSRQALDEAVGARKREMTELGETKARAALQAGADEAERAVRESASKAARARQIGEEKVNHYRSYDRAARIATAAREMAAEAAHQMDSEAKEVAAAVRKDATDLAEKFRREAREAAAKFDEARTAAQRKIDQEQSKSIEGINKSADDAITGLQHQSNQLATQLISTRADAVAQVETTGAAAARAVSGQSSQVERDLDVQTTQADAAIDQFSADVATQLPGVTPAGSHQVVDEADAHLCASLADFDSQQAAQVTQVTSQLSQGAGAVQQRLVAGVTNFVGPLRESATRFEATAADTESKTNGVLDDLAKKTTDSMQQVTPDVNAKLGEAVADSGSRWDAQLDEGRRQMARKVDEAMASQDRALGGLGQRISDKAEEIEHESWWERALSFAAGIIVGFFEELWELVKGLLLVLLVVLVIILVIALVVVVILLVVKGAAGIAAVSAFIAAVVAVAKVVLVVVAVVGAVIVVALVAWRLYQAWTRDDLSDYERGKLVGRSITDILTLVVPGRALTRLRGWLRLRQLARLVGGQARLARLLTWAGGDLAALERLAGELGHVDDFELLLRNTASIDEFLRLRRLCNDSLPLTLRLLRRGRADDLFPAIAEFGGDAVLLDRLAVEMGSLAEARALLGMAGRDVARLRRWVQFFDGGQAASAMFVRVGRDANVLDVIVARTANPAEATRLLNRLANNGPLLRDLLVATDDVPQLDALLSMMANNGVELRRLLALAGGRPSAAHVRELMTLARSEGRAASSIEALLVQAGPNPAEVGRLLGIARRFAGRQRAPANITPAPGYSGANLQHFLDGHTYPFFDFNRVTAQGKTLWPARTPGEALAQVQADLQAVLNTMTNPGSIVTRVQGGATAPTPVHVVPPAVPPAAGQIRGPVFVGNFQFGTRGAAPHEVGQFFPRPGGAFEHFSQPLLQAIQQMMTP